MQPLRLSADDALIIVGIVGLHDDDIFQARSGMARPARVEALPG